MANGSGQLAHRFFIFTLIAKGLLGVSQLLICLAILLGIDRHLPRLVNSIFAPELREDPTDILARKVLAMANALPETDHSFLAIYFGAHGALHVGVVALLLLGSRRAYPLAIAVLAGFVVYQTIEWFTVGGAMFMVLNAIDLFVIWLTVIEWRRRASTRDAAPTVA